MAKGAAAGASAVEILKPSAPAIGEMSSDFDDAEMDSLIEIEDESADDWEEGEEEGSLEEGRRN